MNANKFFTLETENRKKFYQVPKQFMCKESRYFGMHPMTKLLYAMLADRNNLSIKNNWIDEDNRIYFIFAQAELCEYLSIDPKTLRKYIKELEKNQLLLRKRQGRSKPDLMYLLQLDYEENLSLNEPSSQSNQQKGNFSPSRTGEFPHLEGEKFPPNNTNINNTDINIHTNQSSIIEYNNIENDDAIEKKIDRLNEITCCSFSRYECKKLIKASKGDVDLIEYIYNNAIGASKNNPIENFMGYILKAISNELREYDRI